MTITAPGLYPDITPADYFAEPCPAPALTNSIITRLTNETPADAWYHHTGLNPDPELRQATVAMRLGDVTHQLALGKGRGYRSDDGRFAKWDDRIPAYADFKARCQMDRVTPIKQKDLEKAQVMADILRLKIETTLHAIAKARDHSGPLDYETEVVFAWQEQTSHGPIWCRGMLDVWCPALMVALDPKITDRLTDKRVRPHMENMGWDQQGVWYERGLSAIFPEHAGRIRFADLMVRPKPPHTFRAIGISDAWRQAVAPQISLAMDVFASCLNLDLWPGYPDEIEMLDPTPWKLKAAIDAAMMAEMEEEDD